MYKELGNLLSRKINGEQAKKYATAIWKKDRFFSWRKSDELSGWYADTMREIGLSNVEPIELPADGKTSFGGICLPRCWEVEEAKVRLTTPQNELIADYDACPCSLMLYSGPTPKKGVTAELIKINKNKSLSGVDVRGKVVFTSEPPGSIDAGLLGKKGALGIISDGIANRETYGTLLEDAVQWHNFTINPFYPPGLWGVTVSPRRGKVLKELLKGAKKAEIHAKIMTNSYPGKLRLPTGVIRGKTSEEIVVTGHLFEQGANDNASGCGLGLEIVRCLNKLIEDKALPQPRRTIRLLPSFEVRGMQAYAHLYRDRLPRLIAGIDLDNVGTKDCEEILLYPNFTANPAYTDFFLADILKWISPQASFGCKLKGSTVNDNVLGEPLIDAPTPVLIAAPVRYWHTSLDTPDKLSDETLKWVGIAAAIYVYFIANADYSEARWLAELVLLQLKAQKEFSRYALGKYLDSVLRLVAGRSRENLKKEVKAMKVSLGKRAAAEIFSKPPVEETERECAKLIPRKEFLGFVGFDDLNAAELAEYARINHGSPGWISPEALNLALFYSDGTRNLNEISLLVKEEFKEVDIQWLLENFLFLKKRGLLKVEKDRSRN